MTIQTKNAFLGSFANDYPIYQKAFPKRDLLQTRVGEEVRKVIPQDRRTSGLEIGTGTGRTAYSVLSANPLIYLTGIDSSGDMINQARTNLREYGSRINLVKADALDFLTKELDQDREEQKMDVVFSALVLHNLERRERIKILDKIYKNLKTGGAFVSLDRMYSDDPEAREEEIAKAFRDMEVYTRMGRADLTLKWIEHAKQDNDEGIILIKGQFEEDLKSAGFRNLSCLSHEDISGLHVAIK